MSTLVEALSVVIPRHVLDAGYPGGTEGYLETARRARGARYAIRDERLACVSFASPADADAFTAPLSALGLGAEDGAPAPIACLDEDFGPTAACPWLRWRRHDDGFTSCWLEWTEPGELAAPPDWLPPRQRSQAGRPAAPRPVSPPPTPADAAPAPYMASMAPAPDSGPNTPPPFRIVPTAIGPLTPISSPAVLAAMEGNSVSNGHALLDADSIDVDSLVASADDVFAEMDYSRAGSEVADEEVGDDWSLPEFQSSDVDASLVDDEAATNEANETAGTFSSNAESVDDVDAIQGLAAVEDAIAVQDVAAADDVAAMEEASPFDYSPVVQELSSGDDLVASHEDAFAEDVAAMEGASPFDYSREVQELPSSDDLLSNQEATSLEIVTAMEVVSPFDYPSGVQDAAAAEDFLTVDDVDAVATDDVTDAEDASAADDAAAAEDVTATDVSAGPDIVVAEEELAAGEATAPATAWESASLASERVFNEQTIGDDEADSEDADDAENNAVPVYIAEDDMSYEDLADMDALVSAIPEISDRAGDDASIWTDEIEDEPVAAPNHENHEALSRTAASNAEYDDVDALFADRDLDAPVSADVESQSVTSAPADESAAHTPASLTPVAMTAVATAPVSVPASAPVAFSGSPLDAVCAHLAERGWRYSQDADHGALFYQTAGGRASYPGFAAADESAQLVWLYTQIPVRVPEHRRAAAVELLTRANHGLAVGNFEFDYTDGEVRFKAVADSADGCFSAAAAGRLLRYSLEACDRYHDSLMQVIYGGMSPADAAR